MHFLFQSSFECPNDRVPDAAASCRSTIIKSADRRIALDVIACLGQRGYLIRTTRPRYIAGDIMTTIRSGGSAKLQMTRRDIGQRYRLHSHKAYCQRGTRLTYTGVINVNVRSYIVAIDKTE